MIPNARPCRHCRAMTAPSDADVCDVCARHLRDKYSVEGPDAATDDLLARFGAPRLAAWQGEKVAP